LGRLARNVADPGRQVFATGDAIAELNRMEAGQRPFGDAMEAVRNDLTAALAGSGVRPAHQQSLLLLLADLDGVAAAMDEIVDEAERIFSFFRTDQAQRAGERMASMSETHNRLDEALSKLSEHTRSIVRDRLNEQAIEGSRLHELEYFINGVALVF